MTALHARTMIMLHALAWSHSVDSVEMAPRSGPAIAQKGASEPAWSQAAIRRYLARDTSRPRAEHRALHIARVDVSLLADFGIGQNGAAPEKQNLWSAKVRT
jgi:hypothetical protein